MQICKYLNGLRKSWLNILHLYCDNDEIKKIYAQFYSKTFPDCIGGAVVGTKSK